MGASARIFAAFILLSAVVAIPTDVRDHFVIDDTRDLSAESSEIISEAVAPPNGHQSHTEPEAAAATGLNDHSIELIGGSQTFFPSFANLFEPRQQNNFRLGFGNQEAAYSQRPNSYRSLLNYPLFSNYRESFGKQNNAAASAPLVDGSSSSILGSGNFGVISGGTFFAQNDEDSDYDDGFSSFYNNGHGRPSSAGYIANPRPNYNQEQFANFRDFADINTPSNSAYSHFVVVYANKNATADEVSEETRKVVSEPKNIIETLELLDNPEYKEVKKPKVSKGKAKLAAIKQKQSNKKEQWKRTSSKSHSHKHDPEEPLLALS